MKKLLFWVVDCWRLVMDNRYNPLRHIHDPSIQTYFTMALFIMWSCYFGVVAWTYMDWENYSIVASIFIHIAVIVPLSITNIIFKEAEKNGTTWYTNFRIKQEIEAMDKRLKQPNYEKRVPWNLDREA